MLFPSRSAPTSSSSATPASLVCSVVTPVTTNGSDLPQCLYHSRTQDLASTSSGSLVSGAGGLYPKVLCGRTSLYYFMQARPKSLGPVVSASSESGAIDMACARSARSYRKRPFTCPQVVRSRSSGVSTTPLVVVSGQGASPGIPNIPAQDVQLIMSLSSEQSRTWM